jgi:hypothetical protein
LRHVALRSEASWAVVWAFRSSGRCSLMLGGQRSQLTMQTRSLLRVAVCCVICCGLVWSVFELVLHLNTARAKHIVPPLTFDKCRVLCVVGCRQERSGPDDTATPFRNSPMALYTADGPAWVKHSKADLLCRSSTTCGDLPTTADLETVQRYIARTQGPYPYGFQSVPSGIYRLTQVDANSTTARLLIGEWQGPDDSITLRSPQTIRYCTLQSSAVGGISIEETTRAITLTRTNKQQCYIHGSITRYWSHLDSKGCINLCTLAPEHSRQSDWELFCGELREMLAPSEPMALLVLPLEAVAGATETELPERIRLDLTPTDRSARNQVAAVHRLPRSPESKHASHN